MKTGPDGAAGADAGGPTASPSRLRLIETPGEAAATALPLGCRGTLQTREKTRR